MQMSERQVSLTVGILLPFSGLWWPSAQVMNAKTGGRKLASTAWLTKKTHWHGRAEKKQFLEKHKEIEKKEISQRYLLMPITRPLYTVITWTMGLTFHVTLNQIFSLRLNNLMPFLPSFYLLTFAPADRGIKNLGALLEIIKRKYPGYREGPGRTESPWMCVPGKGPHIPSRHFTCDSVVPCTAQSEVKFELF